jgi:hypothetical protein
MNERDDASRRCDEHTLVDTSVDSLGLPTNVEELVHVSRRSRSERTPKQTLLLFLPALLSQSTP